MSEKKTAVKAAEKEISEEQTTESLTASKDETGNAEDTAVMYVGPTIPGVAIQNTVYSNLPDGAKAASENVPAIRNLFIPITKYPDAARMLRDGKGYIVSAYQKALEYKKRRG